MTAPLVLGVHTAGFAPMDWAAAPLSVDVVARDAGPGFATIVLDSDDDGVDALSAPGARLTVDYRYDPLSPLATMRVLSGRVTERSGSSGPTGTRTFDVVGDAVLWQDVLGWPNPTGTITEQGDEDAYYTVTGPAETVLKSLLGANAVDRLRLPVTIAPDLGRGGTISIAVRMHPLADRLWPAVDLAGLVTTVVQDGPGLVVDVHTPAVIPDTLTQASGVVLDGTWSLTAPTATRAVVLGQGVGTARTMRLRVDTAREAEWQMVSEIVVDARDTDDPTILDLRGDQALAAAGPMTGLQAELAESDDFRYGVAFQLGDVVTVQLDDSPVLTDRVRQVRIQWTPDDGLLVTPRVGDAVDDPDTVLWQAVTRLARTQRDQGVT